MARPFFSILTAVYNAEEFIEETISTMFLQTFQDWEWIIVNDGSTDRTWEIVTRLTQGDPRIRRLENPRNLGQRKTLSILLAQATGEWAGYLHADDGYRAHTLKTVHTEVKARPEMMLWTHSRLAVGKSKVPDVILLYKHRTEFTTEEFADLHYLRGALFGGMSNYLFRRPEPTRELDFFDGTHSVDLRFWIRFLKAHPGKAMYYPDVLAYMTEHENSVSAWASSTGQWVSDFFTIPRDVGYLDWSVRARLLQIVRLLKCWVRFLPSFSRTNFWLPGHIVLSIVRSFFRSSPRPS